MLFSLLYFVMAPWAIANPGETTPGPPPTHRAAASSWLACQHILDTQQRSLRPCSDPPPPWLFPTGGDIALSQSQRGRRQTSRGPSAPRSREPSPHLVILPPLAAPSQQSTGKALPSVTVCLLTYPALLLGLRVGAVARVSSELSVETLSPLAIVLWFRSLQSLSRV